MVMFRSALSRLIRILRQSPLAAACPRVWSQTPPAILILRRRVALPRRRVLFSIRSLETSWLGYPRSEQPRRWSRVARDANIRVWQSAMLPPAIFYMPLTSRPRCPLEVSRFLMGFLERRPSPARLLIPRLLLIIGLSTSKIWAVRFM